MADNYLQSGERYLALSCAQSLEKEILPTKPEMLGDGGLHPLRSVPKKLFSAVNITGCCCLAGALLCPWQPCMIKDASLTGRTGGCVSLVLGGAAAALRVLALSL